MKSFNAGDIVLKLSLKNVAVYDEEGIFQKVVGQDAEDGFLEGLYLQ